jgi:ABC-2 type transport system ATP-binding protein
MQAERERDRLRISTRSAEVVLTRLFGADPALQDIEVRRAGLAEAFTELTMETKQEKLS